MHRTTSILGLLLVCLLIVGCGGDDDGDDGGGSAAAGNGAAADGSSPDGAEQGNGQGNGGARGSGEADADTNEPGSGSESSPSGSDSGGGSSTGKEEFVEQANAICERASRRIFAALTVISEGATDSNQDAIEVRTVKEAFIPGLLGEIEQIRDLGLPSEGRGQVEAFLDATMQIVKRARRNPLTFDEQGNPYAAAEELATKYGLTACPVSPVGTN